MWKLLRRKSKSVGVLSSMLPDFDSDPEVPVDTPGTCGVRELLIELRNREREREEGSDKNRNGK